MVGGYQIIDLKNHNFSTGQTTNIKGVYNKIINTTKPILVTNLNLNYTLNSFFALCTKEETKVKLGGATATGDIISIVITEDDDVIVET